jgi:YSIRK-targeted surface antigen transcriptional regulator
MKFEDLKYICDVIGNLAGIPIRIYKGNNQIYYYSLVNIIKDPIIPYKEDIMKINNHIGYFITPIFLYYGIVNSDEYKIVLGPSFSTSVSLNDLRNLAFECDVNNDEIEDFISSLKSLVPLPLNSILQMLCSINFILNNEKLSLSDIALHEKEQFQLEEIIKQEEVNQVLEKKDDLSVTHNTYHLEEKIMNIISHGDIYALKELVSFMPAIRPGVLSSDALRQAKNTFIVTTTLASRAAIRGGMDINESFSISDGYIQKCDLLNSLDKISQLQFHMIYDYTEKVSKIRIGKEPSKFLIDVSNYIQKHISEPIDIQKMADEFYFSRTYLATKFKKETNDTLSNYILKAKVEEGKRLLRYSDKSISSIGFYLGFSSQSHFSNVFSKYVKISPNEYRNIHKHN